jgi:hypothetical protein
LAAGLALIGNHFTFSIFNILTPSFFFIKLCPCCCSTGKSCFYVCISKHRATVHHPIAARYRATRPLLHKKLFKPALPFNLKIRWCISHDLHPAVGDVTLRGTFSALLTGRSVAAEPFPYRSSKNISSLMAAKIRPRNLSRT